MAVLKAGCFTTSAAVRGISPHKKEEKGEEEVEEEARSRLLCFINRHVRAQDNELNPDAGQHDKMTSRFMLPKVLFPPIGYERFHSLYFLPRQLP